MALFVIGDTHLALGCDKPMDIFKGWEGYLPKLEKNWKNTVKNEDTVVVAGDISWAMKLENTAEDFAFLEGLPGEKILLKGNHDLWWSTLSKMEAFLQAQGFRSLHFLHNNCFLRQGLALCGTRGWMAEDPQGHDAKMMNREALRLRASLEHAKIQFPDAEKVVFLHYPPFYSGVQARELTEVLEEYGVRRCFYGHLHSHAIRRAVQGQAGGVHYRLVSADHLGFIPLEVERERP
ncbi:metallophosphoesterase [Ruminococcaceae bacterium OttesenSCG-928-I18]|nr:metallophosphoesterase [Ruminococcaceae bacterium OttesenSCG-928-I18]